MNSKGIFWIREDFRIENNPALSFATQSHDSVIALYIYNNSDFDNRREFAESLRRQHPDEVRVTWKWGRWHHHIDYSQFQNTPPTLKSGLNIKKGHTNEYGLKLVKLKPEVDYG